MALDSSGNYVSGTADSLLGRLQQERNPVVSTDQGTNSVSPYFLAASPQGTEYTIRNLSNSWQGTQNQVAMSDAQAQAKIAQQNATKAAQAAADKAKNLVAQMQKGAIAADAKNQQALQKLRQAAGQYANSIPSYFPSGTGPSGMRGVSSTAGVDAESTSTYLYAINHGYAGRVNPSNYSKSYTYDPTLDAGRNKAMALASSYLGTRYVLGGESQSAIDCSGLVQAVYQQLGFRVPTHSAADQGQTGGRNNGNGIPGVRTSISNLQPGDIVAWRDGSHIAIYAGHGEIIEAANANVGTVRRKLWAPESAVVGIHLNL